MQQHYNNNSLFSSSSSSPSSHNNNNNIHMRIRKRFLSLSAAFTTPPSSDLLSGNHHHHHQPPLLPPVQRQELQPNGNHHRPLPPSSSDHHQQIGLPSGDCSHPNNTKIFNELESLRKKEFIKTDDDTGCRKESILCAEAKNHDLVLKGWLQGDRLVPTKKKRGSFGRRLNNDVLQDDEMIEGAMKPKAKTNDKCVTMSSKKIEKREGVIMEGSRCSRVNGRGWRCSQLTLVGYSLCEHHLGKGRLRSMTSVRGRAQTVARKEQDTKDRKDQKAQSPLVDHGDDDDDDDDDDDEEFKDWDVESMSSMKGTKVFGKKRKLGVVKARSLSSLLSQISS